MKRRTFLAGVGSTALGGAVVIGTGAFAANRVDREMRVSETNDSDALLGLVPTSEYARIRSTGEIVLEMNELNPNSDVEFRNVFRIDNNGENDVRVQFYEGGSMAPLPDGPLAIAVSEDPIYYGEINDIETVNTSPSPAHWPGDSYSPGIADAQDIDSGESSFVHIGIFTNEETETLGSSASTDIDDVPDQLGIYAEAAPETGPL